MSAHSASKLHPDLARQRRCTLPGSADAVAAQACPPAQGLWQGDAGAAGRARMYFCSAVSSSDASLSQPSAAPSARNCSAAASPQPRRRSCTGAAAAASCAASASDCAPSATCKHVQRRFIVLTMPTDSGLLLGARAGAGAGRMSAPLATYLS